MIYALCTDRTPNRATVSRLYATAAELRAAHDHFGSERLDLIAVVSDDALEIGERIWHGSQAIGIRALDVEDA